MTQTAKATAPRLRDARKHTTGPFEISDVINQGVVRVRDRDGVSEFYGPRRRNNANLYMKAPEMASWMRDVRKLLETVNWRGTMPKRIRDADAILAEIDGTDTDAA